VVQSQIPRNDEVIQLRHLIAVARFINTTSSAMKPSQAFRERPYCMFGRTSVTRVVNTVSGSPSAECLMKHDHESSLDQALMHDPESAREFLIRNDHHLLFRNNVLMPDHLIRQFELLDSFNLPLDVQSRIFRGNAIRLLGLKPDAE
jgi:hypothetical protein